MKFNALIEQVITAYRNRDHNGSIVDSPAWHDLTPDERQHAFELTLQQRQLEQAIDPEGLSTTVRAVLARINNNTR
jgi:hypothetical protein